MANSDTNFPIAGTGLTLSADAQWGVGMATITDGSVIAIGGPSKMEHLELDRITRSCTCV